MFAGDSFYQTNPLETLEGATSGHKLLAPEEISGLNAADAWVSFDGDHGTKAAVAIDRCAKDDDSELGVMAKDTGPAVCISNYDCSVAGVEPFKGTDAETLWQGSAFVPAVGKCANVRACMRA